MHVATLKPYHHARHKAMNLALLLRGYLAKLLFVCLVCHLLEKNTVERKTIHGGGVCWEYLGTIFIRAHRIGSLTLGNFLIDAFD